MSRKHSLSELAGLGVSESDDQTAGKTSRTDYVRRGASRAMQKSLGDLAESAKLVTSGDVIVSLDPELIDPSFFADRIEENEKEFADLVVSMQNEGTNSSPILVRPNPNNADRYMIVFGHRRWKAARTLGVKVRAVVKSIEDIGHIIAQGQENTARSNLSFIEKAMAAGKLEAMGQSRETIKAALSVDDAAVSRMLAVAAAIDHSVIYAIGAAKKVGRDRWEELKRLMINPKLSEAALTVIKAPEFAQLPSNERFEHLLKTLKESGRAAKSRGRAVTHRSQWAAPDKSVAVDFHRTNQGVQMKFTSKEAGEFGDYLVANFDRLFADFQKRKGTE